jgi:hypothetical protein
MDEPYFRLFGSLCLKPVFVGRVSHILQGKDKKHGIG